MRSEPALGLKQPAFGRGEKKSATGQACSAQMAIGRQFRACRGDALERANASSFSLVFSTLVSRRHPVGREPGFGVIATRIAARRCLTSLRRAMRTVMFA